MNHRVEILEEYLRLARKAQEINNSRRHFKSPTLPFDKVNAAFGEVLDYAKEHGITRQELTDYKKRDNIKVKTAEEAVTALNRFFS